MAHWGWQVPSFIQQIFCYCFLLAENTTVIKRRTVPQHLGSNIGDAAATAKSLQSCLTLCNPVDGNPPGSPVPGILQARTLEWVAIAFSNIGDE